MIYVSGKLESLMVGGIIDRLKREEYDVFDWRAVVAQKPYSEGGAINEAAALFMDYGVKKADWFILVVENGIYGGMAELGMAIAYASDPMHAKRITVALPSDFSRESVFFMHPEVEVVTLDELYADIDRQIAEAERFAAEYAGEGIIDAEVVENV